MSLRSIILKFLRHVEKLESQSVEGDDMYDKEFQKLKSITDEFRSSPHYSCSVGEQDVNRRKNRYKDILPYDDNRVVLNEIAGVPGSDYINASYIKGASGSTAYIASQAPLPHTVNDFWRMIWECEVQVILMACNEIESGRRKCEKYWPEAGEKKEFGDITVNLVQQRDLCSDFNAKKLRVSRGNVSKNIHHCHYHTWPDHGIPVSVKALLEMVKLAREFQSSETLPLLVHCSAGCGRTGTVCAVDYVAGLLRAGKLTEDFSLHQLILEMRKQRIAMVQTKDQYVLVHKAVRELFLEHMKIIDSHPYENVDFAGLPVALKTCHDYENLTVEDVMKEPDEGRIEVIEETGLKSPPEDKQNEGDRLNCRRGSVSKNDSRSFSGQLPTVDLAPPLPVKVKIGHVGKDNGTSQENLINSSHRNSPPTNQRSRNNSRMDYVNDWCEGISTSQNEIIDGFVVVKPSTGQLQTELSPELRRSKPQLSNDAKIAPGKPKISNLVRKPSIAKLKALFEGDVNTDSSGPPSSDSCSTDLPVWKRTQNRKDSEPSILTQFASDPDHTTLVPPIRSKHKTKSRTLYINKDEYEHVLKRYEDTSFRIFKEFKLSSAEDLSSSYTELLRCSPSLSTQSEERLRHQDEDSNCSSPYEVRRRSRSTSHSPSSAITDNVSSKSDSVTLQAKELMGRLVGSKRNSFAEKRNSTWYDDTHMLQEMTQHERPSNNTQTKVPLYLSNLEKDKQTNSKKSNTAVKRSISMKVGFRSPLIRRKNIRSDKVAAYLAVEDSGKSRENPSHDRACSQQVEESSMNNTGENITNVNAESYNASKKPAKRLHGHTNVKPVQNPTFFTLSGNPVELTKFIPRDDDTESLECLHDRNKKMYSKTSSHLPDMKSNRQSSGDSLQDIPYGSPVTNRKMKQIKENRPPGNKNLNITKTSLPDIKVDSDRSDIGSTYGSKETFEPESRLTKSAAVDDSSANESRQRIQDGSHEHNGKAATEFNRNHLPINNMTSSLKEGSHIKSDADQFASNSFPSSSLPEIATAKEHPTEHRPHRQDALNGNSYGAEMDEYCQKIIHDCQEYLVNHQYSNLTLEAKNNLFWIENTLQQSPRRAIVDVMSLSQESLKNCKHEHDKHVKGLDSIPNYEKLWFSHTGAIAHSPTKPDTGDTSVEEVTVVFTPNDEEEDETSDDRYPIDKFPNELPEKGAASREYFNVVTYPGPSSDPKVVVPTPASRTPKDAKFSKTVTELKSLIEELEVGMPSKPRKPQPAPRTILASSERAGSPVCYPKNTVTTEMNSNVIQMNSSAFRSADVCDPPSNHDNDKNYFLETDRKVNLNLSQSPLGHMNEHVTTPHLGRDSGKEKLNHEYEEIVFKDDGRDAQPEDHIYEKLCVDSEFPDDLFGQYGNNDRHFQYHIPSDKFQHQTKDIDNHCSASKLYGQVHKPKRKKRHNGMKGSLADDVIAHHPDTFSHKLGKCEHDYESLQMTTSWKRVTESSSRPVAPPRLRRNPSTSDKSFQDLYICRSSTDSSVVTKLNQETSEEPKTLAKSKWEAKCDQPESDDVGNSFQDDNDELPPVPVKTKDAYRLPKGVVLANNQSISTSIDGTASHEKAHGKAFNKFHSNIFSKLIPKSDKDLDTSAIGSGSSMLAKQEAQKASSSSEIDFPQRLDKKPKGPRDPPAHWEVKA